MELKQNELIPISPPTSLLIVPYGIETSSCRDISGSFSLLIVPYGIETRRPVSFHH